MESRAPSPCGCARPWSTSSAAPPRTCIAGCTPCRSRKARAPSSGCSSGCARPRPAQAPRAAAACTCRSVRGSPFAARTARRPGSSVSGPMPRPCLRPPASARPRCPAAPTRRSPPASCGGLRWRAPGSATRSCLDSRQRRRAESSLYIWYSDEPLAVFSCQRDSLVPDPSPSEQQRDEVGHVRRAEARGRVPARAGGEAADAAEAVVAGGDVVERASIGVALADVIQRRVDRTQPVAALLVGQGDDARPLRRARAGATEDEELPGTELGTAPGRDHAPPDIAVVSDVRDSALLVVWLEGSLVARPPVNRAEAPARRAETIVPDRFRAVRTAMCVSEQMGAADSGDIRVRRRRRRAQYERIRLAVACRLRGTLVAG